MVPSPSSVTSRSPPLYFSALVSKFPSIRDKLKEAVTNVSHDLRTPLTAICGYLELLDKGNKTPDQARYLALIYVVQALLEQVQAEEQHQREGGQRGADQPGEHGVHLISVWIAGEFIPGDPTPNPQYLSGGRAFFEFLYASPQSCGPRRTAGKPRRRSAGWPHTPGNGSTPPTLCSGWCWAACGPIAAHGLFISRNRPIHRGGHCPVPQKRPEMRWWV